MSLVISNEEYWNILFFGDIEKLDEKEFINLYSKHFNIVLSLHYGSTYSSNTFDFVNTIRLKILIVSSELPLNYKHSNYELLACY